MDPRPHMSHMDGAHRTQQRILLGAVQQPRSGSPDLERMTVISRNAMADSVVTGRAWEVAPSSPNHLIAYHIGDLTPGYRHHAPDSPNRRSPAIKHHGPACSCPRKEHHHQQRLAGFPLKQCFNRLHGTSIPVAGPVVRQTVPPSYVDNRKPNHMFRFLYQFYSGLTASSHGSSCLRRALLSAPHQGLCVGTPRNRVRRRDVVRGIAKCRHSQHRRGYPAMISSSHSAPAPQQRIPVPSACPQPRRRHQGQQRHPRPRAAARFRNEANYMAELSAHPTSFHPRRRRDQHRTWLHRAGIRARRLL